MPLDERAVVGEGCKLSSHHVGNLPSRGSQGRSFPAMGCPCAAAASSTLAGIEVAPCCCCRCRWFRTGSAPLPLASAAASPPLNHASFLLPCSRTHSLLSKNNNTAPLARRPYVSYMVGEGACKLCTNEWGLLAQRLAE